MKTKFTTILLIAGFICAQSQTWTWFEDSLSYARQGHSATVMDDSIFYSMGQGPSPGPTYLSSIIDIYDIGEDVWDTYEAQTPERWQTSAVSANGMVFIAGGNDYNPDITWNWYSEIDVYTKETGEWTIENLSKGRMWMGTVANGNKVFFAGGISGVDTTIYHDVIDIYDTETKTWLPPDSLSIPRCLMGATAAGSKVFFAGGNTAAGEVTNVVDIYDTETGLWDTIYLSEARAYIAAVTYEDKVYFAGGALPNNTSSVVIDIYNINTGLWTVESLSEPRIVTAHNVYNALVFTGMCDYYNLNNFTIYYPNGTVEIYYPATGQWDFSVPDLYPARFWYASTSYDNRVYYAGGSITSGKINTISILDLATSISNNAFHEKVLHVNPNPFTTTLRIEYNLQHPGKVNIAIYNNIGEKVRNLMTIYQQQGDQQVIFDTEKLSPGIYFCTLKTSEGIQTKKIIKL